MHDATAGDQDTLAKLLAGKHIPALDGLRGFAILMVVWFHIIQMSPEYHTVLPGVITRAASLGQMGVDLFFVLSGFLITGILIDTRHEAGYLQNFFARRTLRIFPLYFVSLSILLAFPREWVSDVPRRQEASSAWMWTYLSNLPPTFSDLSVRFSHFWSLAVEEQFYLIWPFVLGFSLRHRLLNVCLLAVVLGVGSRWLFVKFELSPFYSTNCRADSLGAGSLLAVIIRMNHSRRQLKVAAFWCSSLVLLGGAVLFWLYSGSGHSVIQIWKHLIAAVLFTGLLAITICDDGDRGLGRVLSHRWLRACGKYSYCLYIIHPVVVSAARRTGWIGTRSMLGFATYCGMVLGVSFLIAFVSWRFLESPMLRLKSRFAYASR